MRTGQLVVALSVVSHIYMPRATLSPKGEGDAYDLQSTVTEASRGGRPGRWGTVRKGQRA